MFHLAAYSSPVAAVDVEPIQDSMSRQLPIQQFPRTERITLRRPDGRRLGYVEQGRGQPMLLLHGWSLTGDAFSPVIPGLAKHYRVIAPDLPAHGISDAPDSAPGIEDMAQAVVELAHHLELQNLVLVGWSMGAMVAWQAWPAIRQRLAGCVIVDMVPRVLSDDQWSFGLREGTDVRVFDAVLDRMRKDWPAYSRHFLPRIFSAATEPPGPLIDQLVDLASSNQADAMAQVWASMADCDFRPMLEQFTVPTLVINGRHSQLYSRQAADWLASRLPNARRVEMARSGHAPPLEQPQEFIQIITEFVQSLTDARKPEERKS